jgi:hypothetical protein
MIIKTEDGPLRTTIDCHPAPTNNSSQHHSKEASKQGKTTQAEFKVDEGGDYCTKLPMLPTPINPNRLVVVDRVSVYESLGVDDEIIRYLQMIFRRGGQQDCSNIDRSGAEGRVVIKQEQEDATIPGKKRAAKSIKNASGDWNSKALPRYRALNSGQWFQKFQELVRYKNKYGNCLVPYKCPDHESLALWVKRQRYQYKFREEGKKSNLTDERIGALKELGFVWSPHGARWEDRFEALKAFIQEYGHCNVPKQDVKSRQLAMWVKSQRDHNSSKTSRGKKGTILTPERIDKLNEVSFRWEEEE